MPAAPFLADGMPPARGPSPRHPGPSLASYLTVGAADWAAGAQPLYGAQGAVEACDVVQLHGLPQARSVSQEHMDAVHAAVRAGPRRPAPHTQPSPEGTEADAPSPLAALQLSGPLSSELRAAADHNVDVLPLREEQRVREASASPDLKDADSANALRRAVRDVRHGFAAAAAAARGEAPATPRGRMWCGGYEGTVEALQTQVAEMQSAAGAAGFAALQRKDEEAPRAQETCRDGHEERLQYEEALRAKGRALAAAEVAMEELEAERAVLAKRLEVQQAAALSEAAEAAGLRDALADAQRELAALREDNAMRVAAAEKSDAAAAAERRRREDDAAAAAAARHESAGHAAALRAAGDEVNDLRDALARAERERDAAAARAEELQEERGELARAAARDVGRFKEELGRHRSRRVALEDEVAELEAKVAEARGEAALDRQKAAERSAQVLHLQDEVARYQQGVYDLRQQAFNLKHQLTCATVQQHLHAAAAERGDPSVSASPPAPRAPDTLPPAAPPPPLPLRAGAAVTTAEGRAELVEPYTGGDPAAHGGCWWVRLASGAEKLKAAHEMSACDADARPTI